MHSLLLLSSILCFTVSRSDEVFRTTSTSTTAESTAPTTTSTTTQPTTTATTTTLAPTTQPPTTTQPTAPPPTDSTIPSELLEDNWIDFTIHESQTYQYPDICNWRACDNPKVSNRAGKWVLALYNEAIQAYDGRNWNVFNICGSHIKRDKLEEAKKFCPASWQKLKIVDSNGYFWGEGTGNGPWGYVATESVCEATMPVKVAWTQNTYYYVWP